MKALVFHIGPDRYAIRLAAIARVLPLLELKQLPLAPPGVAGLLDYHGASVPVIDLCRLAGMPAAPPYYDTRIVLLDYAGADGAAHLLGLLAQGVRGVRELAPEALGESGVRAAPFLGQVAGDADGMLQLVEVAQLLPDSLRAQLFPAGAAP